MATEGALTGKEAAALAVARGATPNQAAAESGASVRSIVRWNNEPEFQTRVREIRRELLDNVLGALSDAGVEAVTALRASLTADSDAVRVRAAQAILTNVVSLRAALDVEERLARLEAQQEHQ